MSASPTPADEISAFIRQIRRLAQTIRPLDRHDTHAFAEDKDAVVRLLDRLDTKFRARFGGTPSRFETGARRIRDRIVTVERRKAR